MLNCLDVVYSNAKVKAEGTWLICFCLHVKMA